MIKLIPLIIALAFMVSCATDSHKIQRLKQENPGCEVNDDAELICPLPWEEETCNDCGAISPEELEKLTKKAKPLPKKKKPDVKKPKRSK